MSTTKVDANNRAVGVTRNCYHTYVSSGNSEIGGKWRPN
jgi:hypothetical protein